MSAIARTILVLACCGFLAACASETPAPIGSGALGTAGPQPSAAPSVRYIVVQPGQSLSRIAQAYHVPERTIIAVNHLTPPYLLKAGARLALPGTAAEPERATAALARPERPATPHPVHASLAAAVKPTPHLKRHPAAPEAIPLDEPEKPAAARSNSPHAVAAATPAAAAASRRPRREPEEIPLDDPPPSASR